MLQQPIQSRLTQILVLLVILEAAIIIIMALKQPPIVIKMQESTPQVVESPIALAARYEAPEKKFEEVVKTHQRWLQYRALGEHSLTVLAECAFQKKTNYVRILLENGADFQTALKELGSSTPEFAAASALVKEVQDGLATKNLNGIPN